MRPIEPPVTPVAPAEHLSDVAPAERFFRISRDLFCVVDADGYIERVNPAFERTLGWNEDALRGRLIIDFVHLEDRPAVLDAIGRVRAGADVDGFENRMLCADGGHRWISWAASGPDERGRIYGVGRDATERRRVEDALRESESRYAHVAANVPGMVYQFAYRPDGTMGYTFVSEGVRRMFGVAPEDAQRDPTVLLDLVHPDDWEQFRALARAAADTSSALHWEGRLVLPSGEVRIVEIVARSHRRPDGTALSDGLILDVTAHRQAEETLRSQAEARRAIFDHIPVMVSFIDKNGRRVFVNREWERVCGWSTDEVQTVDVLSELYPDPVDRARTAAFLRAATGEWGDFRMRTRDGRVLDTVWACVGLSNGSVVSIGQDVTDRRRLEEQLQQAHKMEAVGQLAGGVAHDFNNLLTVIRSYAEFLAEDLSGDGGAQDDIEEILKAAERASDLTRQLLAFGRKQVLQPRTVDVNRKVTNVLGMLRRVIGEDIAIETHLEPRPWPTRADAGQLEQVLMNLAVNARDAMPAGGTLRFRTRNVVADGATARTHAGLAAGEYVALAVEDTGTGIEPAALPHIFEPFFTTKGPGKGTGLGLATAYGIVKQSGGHIDVDSAVGRGSCFTILLPRADAPADADIPAIEASAPRGTETILLVEDEVPVRAVVRRMLERQGYTVVEAGSAADAVRLARAPGMQIDLLITDVVMPAENGRRLAEQLAAGRPALRVLYMSGYADDEILRRGLTEPGRLFLEKPFTADRLARTVRAVLDAADPSQR